MKDNQSYEIIRSPRRKRLALQIMPDGRLVVRAPQCMSLRTIEKVVGENRDWIETHRRMMMERPPEESSARTSLQEIQKLMEQAKTWIPQRAAYFAPLVGVTYGRITIRHQKTKWGSCSSKGNLNFNCMLMKLPPELLDYVVVHELCHRLEMNHSPRFWAQVERVMPDYRQRREQLKQYHTM